MSSTVPENPIWAQLSNTGLSPKTHDMFARPEPKSRVKFAYTAYTTESFRSKGSPSCVVSNETFVKSHGCSTKGRIQSITWWTHQTVCDCLWGVSERVPFLPDKKRTQTHTHTHLPRPPRLRTAFSSMPSSLCVQSTKKGMPCKAILDAKTWSTGEDHHSDR